MPPRHGKLTRVLVDGSNLSPYLNEANQNRQSDTPETTTFGVGNKTYVVGFPSGDVAFTGFFDGDAGAVDAILSPILGDDTPHVLSILPEGSPVGRVAKLATFRESAYNTAAGVGGAVGVNGTFTTDGISRGLVLSDFATAVTADGNGADVDNGTATTAGGIGQVHFIGNTRNGLTTVKIQHSLDGSTWVDLLTFTSGSGVSQGARQTVSGTVQRHLRAIWTLAGSSGSVAIAAAFART